MTALPTHLGWLASLWLVSLPMGLSDYELRTPTESIKVQGGLSACLAVQKAIAEGFITSIPPQTRTVCLPHPFYFTPAEGCIRGFNCGSR